MTAQHQRLDVLDTDLQPLGDERAVARRVEYAGHAEDPAGREARGLIGHVGHDVERVRDHDADGIGGCLLDRVGDVADNPRVRGQKVVAAHPGLARDACGDDDDLAASGFIVSIRTDNASVEAHDRARLVHVESFALWDALQDVDDHDLLGDLHLRQTERLRSADVSRTNNSNFIEHTGFPIPRAVRTRPFGARASRRTETLAARRIAAGLAGDGATC